jgi:hypothetical protein
MVGMKKNVHFLLGVGFKAPPRGIQGRNSTGPALSNGVYPPGPLKIYTIFECYFKKRLAGEMGKYFLF